MNNGRVLAVNDLSIRFRTDRGIVRAVESVSFDLARGETLGIVGESGSGKTVLSLALLGLLPRERTEISGSVTLDGLELLGQPSEMLQRIRGKRVAMIFQDPMSSLNPFLTIGRQMTEGIELHLGLRKEAARRRAVEMLEQAGLPDSEQQLNRYPHQLSGGMRQRVMIGMALACDPELLIADEPTTALDVTIQAQIMDLLKDLRRRSNLSIILITHDLGVVAGMADRVQVMYAGRVMEAASAGDLYRAPSNPYTIGLMRSIPDSEKGGELYQIEGSPPNPARLPAGCPFSPRCAEKIDKCAEPAPYHEVGSAHFSRCWVR